MHLSVLFRVPPSLPSPSPSSLLLFSGPPQDDMQIRVFNYNTLERAHMFEAHSDYIRCIAVHPTQPYILTSSGTQSVTLLFFLTPVFLYLCQMHKLILCHTSMILTDCYILCVSRRHANQAVGLGEEVVLQSGV